MWPSLQDTEEERLLVEAVERSCCETLEFSEKEAGFVAGWWRKGPLHSPQPNPPPPTRQLTGWITRFYGQDYDGAVADLGSASSPTEHGDLLTPRGVWTCRTPERLLPLGGQGKGNTCSGTRSFLDLQCCLHTNSHLNFTKKFVPLA